MSGWMMTQLGLIDHFSLPDGFRSRDGAARWLEICRSGVLFGSLTELILPVCSWLFSVGLSLAPVLFGACLGYRIRYARGIFCFSSLCLRLICLFSGL